MRGHRIFGAVFAAALTAFTGYLALDTFVLKSVYQTDTTQMNLTMFEAADSTASAETTQAQSGSSNPGGADSSGRRDRQSTSQSSAESGPESTAADSGTAAVSSQNSYKDENISITLTDYRVDDTTVYVADVQLSSAQYLKSAFAYDTYGRNVTAATSQIADAHNAILAVNGDYYGAQERGYVIRNGIVYRESSNGKDLLCINADGSMTIVNSDDYSADELVAQGVWQAYCFGPALLENGSISVSQSEEVGRAMASNPRTAIGILDNLHYVLVVSDGRTRESTGLSLYQMAAFMQQLGVQTAYNLDGGGSSTMYFQGEVINNPTTNGNRIQERGVSDIVYIG